MSFVWGFITRKSIGSPFAKTTAKGAILVAVPLRLLARRAGFRTRRCGIPGVTRVAAWQKRKGIGQCGWLCWFSLRVCCKTITRCEIQLIQLPNLSWGIGMLNWAARYYPILRALKEHGLLQEGSILEIGSGPAGLGEFRKVPFVGCDLSFERAPVPPMIPLVASATDLPFADRSFDAVIASDVLEHVSSELRTTVIAETLRVASRLVIFGFPCGEPAYEVDKALRQTYLAKHRVVPVWLEEHMIAPFPESSLFRDLPGWKLVQFGNEHVAFHSWMMRQEMRGFFVRATNALRKLAPAVLEHLLRRADRPPYYRQIFVLSRST
jgi:Methyltransferase domain